MPVLKDGRVNTGIIKQLSAGSITGMSRPRDILTARSAGLVDEHLVYCQQEGANGRGRIVWRVGCERLQQVVGILDRSAGSRSAGTSSSISEFPWPMHFSRLVEVLC